MDLMFRVLLDVLLDSTEVMTSPWRHHLFVLFVWGNILPECNEAPENGWLEY